MQRSDRQTRDAVIDRLRAAGCVYAEDEADLLLADSASAEELAGLVERRVAGEPLEQIVGWAEFCGLRLTVRPGVFVPRRRTELLVRQAIAMARPGDVLVDQCCGVGAVAAAVTSSVGGLEVYAVDLDPVAVDCARDNLGPAGQALAGDLFAALPDRLRGRVAMITANAPYVPTDEIALMPTEARDHEARVALDGGPDGLDLHRRIVAAAGDWLRPGGRVLIETGRAQAATDLELLGAAGFAADVVTDDAVDATVVIGRGPTSDDQ